MSAVTATMKAAQGQMFSLMYLLTEGAGKRNVPRAWGLFTITIELLQIVRILTQPAYGWTRETQDMARWFDLVAVVGDQIRQWVPFIFFW
ncbi:hypothetical protein T484DRAFT_1908461, partial [Baffinella frigidus]